MEYLFNALILIATACLVQPSFGFWSLWSRKDALRFSKFDLHNVSETRRSPFSKMFAKVQYGGPKKESFEDNFEDMSEPLFLSHMITQRRIREAQDASKVSLLGYDSYTGFITVNQSCNSSMFFWYFPSKAGPDKPLLLWLQGGPGGSSLYGLFVEHGPYTIDKDGNAHKRKVNWVDHYSVVYVDNPVGTGFSFTGKDECYAKNQDDVARDLYSFMVQFYKLFPDLLKVPFYATGESYAGKYVPAIAFKIHQENQMIKANPLKNRKNRVKIPLAGIAIGDGFTDPIQMCPAYAPLLYQIGLLDEVQSGHMDEMFSQTVELFNVMKANEAFKVFDAALNGDLTPYPSYFTNCTGTKNYFNYLLTLEPEEYNYYGKFLARKDIRELIHVGSMEYHSGTVVEQHMIGEFLNSVSRWVEKLLDNDYEVLFYNGDLDIIVGLPLTQRLLWSGLNWKHAEDYRKAERKIWKLSPSDIEVAGYVRKTNNLYQVGIRGGGHMVPAEQPERVLDMMQRFISGTL